MVYVAQKTISGKQYYYLVKSIKVGGRVQKLQRYLGKEAPSSQDLERLERVHGSWFEAQAVKAKAKLAASKYEASRLEEEALLALEQAHYQHLSARKLLTAKEVVKAGQRFKPGYLGSTLALAGCRLEPHQIQAILLEESLPPQITLKQVKLLLNLEELNSTLATQRGGIDLTQVLKLHKALSRGLYENEGQLRTDTATLNGSSFQPLPAILLEDELQGLLASFNRPEENEHPFEAACGFHHRWGQLHPFEQGNGLLGRELFNHQLRLAGFPPCRYPADPAVYLGPLQAADSGDMTRLVNAYASFYLEHHLELLESEGGLERAVRSRRGQAHLGLFERTGPTTPTNSPGLLKLK